MARAAASEVADEPPWAAQQAPQNARAEVTPQGSEPRRVKPFRIPFKYIMVHRARDYHVTCKPRQRQCMLSAC
eukprot:2335053-Pyramimonas_sp.AAC.1